MQFSELQPQSFLDYAWTTPSSAAANTTKPSKTSRKQNRCCDQCRKGKRACDAAILEDTLLDANGPTAGNPTVFHYSDVFGPLAACSNCEKTKKNCTFEWLRTQRVSQAAAPQSNSAPPAKKRRTQSASSQTHKELNRQSRVVKAPPSTEFSDTPVESSFLPRNDPFDFGLTFADFPGGVSTCDLSLASSFAFDNVSDVCNGSGVGTIGGASYLGNGLEDEDKISLDRDSGIQTSPEVVDDSGEDITPSTVSKGEGSNLNGIGPVMRMPRKRRRRSFSSTGSASEVPAPTISFASDLLASTNNVLITDGLLKIYQDSFENHLSCWLTERTCPYNKDSEVSLPNDDGPDWNRIYYRVFKLDRLSSVRGRSLSAAEDKTASKALNLAIFSFATQWAKSTQKNKAKYPFRTSEADDGNGILSSDEKDAFALQSRDFDRMLQESAWHHARMALQAAEGIESFRVVLAQIVFSLTQRPATERETSPEVPQIVTDNAIASALHAENEIGDVVKQESPQPEDHDLDECEDLLSKLNLTIDREGPPIHLEQGLRLIHSLRSRMTVAGTLGVRAKKTPRYGKKCYAPSNRLEAADRATVDLLFWLGIMFDTLSSAMHKRPLVVSLEDSDLPAAREMRSDTVSAETPIAKPEDLWDDYLFRRQRRRQQRRTVRWPFSYEAAAGLLCDAAPIKVLLFRKITRIQTMLSRRIKGERIEKAIQAALEVYDHWQKSYAPFIRNCIENHDYLPSQVQSWYICLAGHWHLATLLLADLIEIIDESELSGEVQRRERDASDFIAAFREKNCRWLSEIARCACPKDDTAASCAGEIHTAMDQVALLTEPWTVVLIRAFATAGAILLESASLLHEDIGHHEEAFRRANHCVRALWYLGRKSDMALSTAKILGEALEQRRKKVQEKMSRCEDVYAFFGDENQSWWFASGIECV